MTFLLFDDNYGQHPKISCLCDGSYRLHTNGILYCGRNLTDGFVHKSVVRTLHPKFRASYLTELVVAGLWIKVNDGYNIHDYLQWNKPRDEVLAAKEKKRASGRAGAQKRWGISS